MSRLNASEDGPGRGRLHTATEANPFDALHADARGLVDPRLLTTGRSHRLGSGDARPPVIRRGAQDAASLPSLMAGSLVYPAPKP